MLQSNVSMMVYSREDLFKSSEPNPTTLQKPDGEAKVDLPCVAYLLLMPLHLAASTYNDVSRSSTFSSKTLHNMQKKSTIIIKDLTFWVRIESEKVRKLEATI